MSKIKLIAFDLDGTALPMLGHETSDSFRRTITEAAAAGVVVSIFTGRATDTIPDDLLKLPAISYISYANGAGVIDMHTGNTIYKSLMPLEVGFELMEIADRLNVPAEVMIDGRLVIPRYMYEDPSCWLPDHHRRSIETGGAVLVENVTDYIRTNRISVDKVNIPMLEGELREQYIEEFSRIPNIENSSSGLRNLEINAYTTNKGVALEWLATHLGLTAENVMAIGDNNNDVRMLKYAGLGVAVGNASQPALDAADYIAETQENNGAELAIRKFVLDC